MFNLKQIYPAVKISERVKTASFPWIDSVECKKKVGGSVFEMPTKCAGGDPLPWDLTSSKPSTHQAHASRTSQNFNNRTAFHYGLVYCTLPCPM
jgi:hypothetical protein